MIVRCPACQIHYRLEAPAAGAVARGICSRCESPVPLVGIRPAYVVLAPRPAAVAVAVGAERPARGFATGRAGTPSGASAAQAAPVWVEESGRPETAPSPPSVASGGPPSLADLRPVRTKPRVGRAREAAGPPTEPRGEAVAAGRGLGRLLAALLCAAAGAAAGYYVQWFELLRPLRPHPLVQPLDLAPVGALLGLLVGWAGIRWTARRR